MGMVAILVMWPNSFIQICISIHPKLSYGIWFQMTEQFQRKTSFNFENLSDL